MTKPLILLTNDDGIESPGLAASATAVDSLGKLLIIAPRVQQTAMGRSMPATNDGRMVETTISRNGRTWPAYGANASPAQAVQHAMLELIPERPVLAVSGINYGENVGIGITVSGTVGAALEAAAYGVPALAVSLQVELTQHLTNDPAVDFSAAIHFTRLFAKMWLDIAPLPDVDVLKIDIPQGATPDTPWRITRVERRPYFRPTPPQRKRLTDAGPIGYELRPDPDLDRQSDAAAIQEGVVSVTPLSLDITSRIAARDLRRALEG